MHLINRIFKNFYMELKKIFLLPSPVLQPLASLFPFNNDKIYDIKLNIGKCINGTVKIKPIREGTSGTLKYYIKTKDSQCFFLRFSDKRTMRTPIEIEFENIKIIETKGILVPEPIEIGKFNQYSFMLLKWIDGIVLSSVLKHASEAKSYEFGIKAGKTLMAIHTISLPDTGPFLNNDFYYDANAKIDLYHSSPNKISDDDAVFINYIKKNRNLIGDRPKCLLHGDYKAGNIMLLNHNMVLIDFECAHCGDPWSDFNFILRNAYQSPFFAVGILHGYFCGQPPENFWNLAVYYLSLSALNAKVRGAGNTKVRQNLILSMKTRVLHEFNYMKSSIPNWYGAVNDKIMNEDFC